MSTDMGMINDFIQKEEEVKVKLFPPSENPRIQQAADNYVGHLQEIDEDLTVYCKREAFIAGALWQRNSVWHNVADGLPEERRNVLATTASPKGRGIMEGGVTVVTDRGLLEADKKGTFKKWAYLSDLFPTDMEL